MTSDDRDATGLLLAWSRGETGALDRLMPLVHHELHTLAVRYMSRERAGHVLQPTALVHEAYLRLVDVNRIQWRDRTHFLAVAARTMRRILVDVARQRGRGKRGGGRPPQALDEAADVAVEPTADLVALHDALTTLASFDPRMSQVVELRFFGGLTVEETADVLDVSPETVMRDWKTAKGWLLRELTR
jgi:RNA polymerase sigma factor (TIGR02999 family)